MSTVTSINGSAPAFNVSEFLNKHRKKANYWVNGIAAGTNLVTFANGNLNFFDGVQEKLESLSFFSTKVATGFSGLINAYISNKGRNPFAALGGLLELPVSFLSEGYNHWLFRGAAIGLNNFQAIFSRLGKRDENGNRTEKKIDEDFKDKEFWAGHFEGFKTIVKEIPHVYKDILKDPKKNLLSFPHLLFSAASLQIIGTSIATFTEQTTLAAGFRNLGGSIVDFSFMLDKAEKGKKSYVPAGSIWAASAFIDFFKRFEPFEALFHNHTQLANIFDRTATALFTESNSDAAQSEPQLTLAA